MRNLNRVFPILTLLFGLLLTFQIQAQKLTVFQHFTADSLPDSPSSEWVAEGKRSGIHLHLQYSEKPAIQEPKMYVFIDQKTPLGEFIEFDTYKIEVPEGATSIEKYYHFKEVGDYAVSFTNADKKVVATDTITIRYDQRLIFCEKVERGKPINIQSEFEPSSTGLYYYAIYLSGSRRLQTHQITMHIYQHDGEGFNIHVGEYKNYVNHSKNYASFRGLFLDPGYYKVQAFKYNGEPYAENYLHLKPQKK